MKGLHVREVFANESGGHRWQRVPPTERKGRVHTSTVTVAVLEEPDVTELYVPDRDLEYKTTKGSGAGGQHRNKVETVVVLTHKPSGISVRCESERSQHQNRQLAYQWLMARLYERASTEQLGEAERMRREQVGSGMRGDKRRTIRTQDEQVIDHISGRHWKLKQYLSGEW